MWDPPRKKKDCIKQSKISLIIIDDEKVENNFLKGQLLVITILDKIITSQLG